MTEGVDQKSKILQTEDLLQSLSEEMLKLKSASQNYDETQKNLQEICRSVDKISETHKELTGNLKQLLPIMEKNAIANEKNQELIQKTVEKNEEKIKKILDEHKSTVEQSLSKQNAVFEKTISQLKFLSVIGLSLEAIIIIALLLFFVFK